MNSGTGLFRPLGMPGSEHGSSSGPGNAPSEGLDLRVLKTYPGKSDDGFTLEADFQVLPGFTVLVGPSGTGKSTLLRCIAGLCDPDEGRIVVGGRVLFDSQQKISIETAERRVAFVFQRLALFPHLTVEENVAYGLRKMKPAEREPRISSILDSFQIAHLRKQLPASISGGEQQRVALARALVTEPSVLLLDEPLSSLDTHTKAGIVEDLRKWNSLHQVPILYVTHSQEEMFALGEQVIVFDPGGVMQEGLPLEVVPSAHAASVQSNDFENLIDVTVVALLPEKGMMRCRLESAGTEMEVPIAQVPPGSEIQLSLRSSEIFLASAKPNLIGACNVISGMVSQVNRIGASLEVLVDCGIELRAQVSADSWGSLQGCQDVWMMIYPRSCRFVRIKRLRPLQRLVVFVCSGNTSRSPIAQAICNAEVARRFRIPVQALRLLPLRAVSAGLSAIPGEPMSPEAEGALKALGIPYVAHKARNLTRELVAEAETIFCMSAEQREKAIAQFPEAATKIHCLDAAGDIEDPAEGTPEIFLGLARRIQGLVRMRLADEEIPAG